MKATELQRKKWYYVIEKGPITSLDSHYILQFDGFETMARGSKSIKSKKILLRCLNTDTEQPFYEFLPMTTNNVIPTDNIEIQPIHFKL